MLLLKLSWISNQEPTSASIFLSQDRHIQGIDTYGQVLLRSVAVRYIET